MNQEKIGNYILELRKEKNMAQQELADKIGVTDKAISKWENGRGMPDLSLMKPLCKELGITINELISGERIDKKEYQEKLEEQARLYFHKK
ncbi:MAG: helix-turn-helix transcriptional regulator [Bacilli bacterium]|nr:helix-turn-helix transcriptional regulator [Bacilli bacterium]